MKDKNGEQIEILSKVLAPISDGLFDSLDPALASKTEVIALVDELLPDERVKCSPIGAGFPFIIDAKLVEVVEPLAASLIDAANNTDVQKIMEEAYSRLKISLESGGRKRSSKTGTASKKAATNLAEGIEM